MDLKNINCNEKIYNVYCSGVFDLLHLGHMMFFNKIHLLLKDKIKYKLIVGIHSDNECEKYKRKPIINENIRYETVKYCKYVDEILQDAPLQITTSFIKLQNIDFVIIGKEYEKEYEKNVFFHRGALELNNYFYIERSNIISTSDIIEIIKKM